MHRFFLSEYRMSPGQQLELPVETVRYLKTVLRLNPGQNCEVFDGNGQVAQACLLGDDSIEILSVSSAPQPECRLSLIQGLPKGDKLELVLQKGTELGINHFLPTQMERSVSRLKGEREQKRTKRWQKIIQEAARQSRQPFLPDLQVANRLQTAIGSVDADLKLLLWEESGEPLSRVLPSRKPQHVAVIVGPEGGVTAEEADIAQCAGYLPVSIGPRILRTETAGLAIMAILQYLYGDLTKGCCSRDAAAQGKDES